MISNAYLVLVLVFCKVGMMGGEGGRIKERKKHGLRKAAFLLMFSNVSGYVCRCVLNGETEKRAQLWAHVQNLHA